MVGGGWLRNAIRQHLSAEPSESKSAKTRMRATGRPHVRNLGRKRQGLEVHRLTTNSFASLAGLMRIRCLADHIILLGVWTTIMTASVCLIRDSVSFCEKLSNPGHDQNSQKF